MQRTQKCNLCVVKDGFFHEVEKYLPHWIVELDDGTMVYQDDERPNVWHHSAWYRLRDYIHHTEHQIVKMHLRFRSHWESLPANKDGYFFCKVARGYYGSKENLPIFSYWLSRK